MYKQDKGTCRTVENKSQTIDMCIHLMGPFKYILTKQCFPFLFLTDFLT